MIILTLKTCSAFKNNGGNLLLLIYGTLAISYTFPLLIRETVPSLTSDMGKKTVLAHSLFLPQRANSGCILSIPHLRHSYPCAEAKTNILGHVLSTWSD